MTTEYLGPCSVVTPEPCPNQATRMTDHGALCDAHRKRLLPSRAGGVDLYAPVAKQVSPRERLREAALAYADADGDQEYKLADAKLARAAKAFAGADDAESVEAYRRQQSKAHARRIKAGIAKAKAQGKAWGGEPKLSRDDADRAVHQHGGVRAAARALGVSRNTLRRALKRISQDMTRTHGDMHLLAPEPRPPEPADSPTGENDAPQTREQ